MADVFYRVIMVSVPIGVNEVGVLFMALLMLMVFFPEIFNLPYIPLVNTDGWRRTK